MLISNCVTYLKKNKSDGDKCLNSNHIINGGHRLSILLSFLFNAMLVHGYYPSELLKSTIISLSKNNFLIQTYIEGASSSHPVRKWIL